MGDIFGHYIMCYFDREFPNVTRLKSVDGFISIYDSFMWIIRIIKIVNIDFGKQYINFQKHFRFGLTMQFIPCLEQLQILAWFHPVSVYPMANIVPLEPL